MNPLFKIYARHLFTPIKKSSSDYFNAFGVLIAIIFMSFLMLLNAPELYQSSGFEWFEWMVSCWLIFGTSLCSSINYNRSFELTLPLPRRTLFLSHLLISCVVWLVFLFIPFGIKFLYSFGAGGESSALGHPLNFFNLILSGYICIVFFLNVFRQFNSGHINPMKVYFQFLLYIILLVMLPMLSAFSIIIPVDKQYILSIIFIIISLIFTKISMQGYNRLSLDGVNTPMLNYINNKAAIKFSLNDYISFVIQSCLILPQKINIITRVILRESFNKLSGWSNCLCFFSFCLMPTSGLFTLCIIIFGTMVLICPIESLKIIGTFPIHRKRIFRIIFIPRLLFIIIILGAITFLSSINLLDFDKNKSNNRFAYKVVHNFDSLFNDLVNTNKSEKINSKEPIWFYSFMNIDTENKIIYEGVANSKLSLKALTTLDPYSFTKEDRPTSVAQQLSKYLKNQYGLIVPTNDILPYWKGFVKNNREQNDDKTNTTLESHSHIVATVNLIENRIDELNGSILKIKVGKAIMVLSMIFILTIIMYKLITGSNLKIGKPWQIFFAIFYTILFSTCFSNYLDTIVNFLLYQFNWAIVQYFNFIIFGFIAFSIFSYFKLESYFEKVEARGWLIK
ncbi:MAG: hypothetical protein COA79_06835 [Planctomycetota bacterium]|nr:MAG: hypothetical protein COA79_06835 [Planctomycetota bacterium]